ncbi:UNVERIFIED_CONTAM: hypothetical protein Slati_3051700 [Sesamum latifolium]|uniref:Uncharacterized protein n=1 Tax=Sesamum latifolium TaxID=2727402 RepID=A0AAW2UUJ6_9LAMI
MDMRRALQAHAERRNAEAGRGFPLPSKDASARSEIVAETHSGRLASRGQLLRDAKAMRAESLRRTWAFRIGERTGTWCRAGMPSDVALASPSVKDTRRTVGIL